MTDGKDVSLLKAPYCSIQPKRGLALAPRTEAAMRRVLRMAIGRVETVDLVGIGLG